MSKFSKDVKAIKAFILDVDGVLSATTLQIGDDGQPIRTTNMHDGFAIRAALDVGYKFAVITGGKTESVVKRYKLLGIEDIYSSVKQKLPIYTEWLATHSLTDQEVAYMGDDLPDMQCLGRAGLSAAPYDACSEVLASVDFVSKFTGGHGCVRDLIESIMRAQGTWPKP